MKDRFINTAINILFILLIAGLFYSQILRYQHYSKLSKNNSIRIIPIDGPRGLMIDRNGVVVVADRISFDVAVVYQELAGREKISKALEEVLGLPRPEISALLEKASRKPYVPVTIVSDIAKEKALALEEASVDVRGLVIETRSRRHYLYDDTAGHVFGYLGEVSEDELEKLVDYGYRMKDLVGRAGLEKYYNTYLAGVDGGMQIEIDSKGRKTRVLGLKEPASGKDLYLTMDIRLQALCDKLLAGKRGAVIVMDPRTGEVLALSSHPSFDPNIFISPSGSSERTDLLNDRIGKPLVDRAISASYAPGSVFKIVTASAALDTNRINKNTRYACGGSYQLGNASFGCWKSDGHGQQDITDGLMNSCNVFFYNTGRAAGVDNIEAYAKLFGFGRPTGIDLPDEAKGLVPGRLWKRTARNETWYEGDTLNYSIGQGYLLATPVQVAGMIAAVANGGSIVRPHLVKRIDGTEISAPKQKNIGLKKSTLETIRTGLFKVVNSETGTGKRARVEGVAIAAKTGTAQNPQGRTHAWFSGFAPYNDPKICVVVFLEHGGKGGLEPADIAKNIFEEAKNKGYL